jgi:hypothetical protein
MRSTKLDIHDDGSMITHISPGPAVQNLMIPNIKTAHVDPIERKKRTPRRERLRVVSVKVKTCFVQPKLAK